MPFYKSRAFVILVLFVVITVVSVFVMRRANAQRGEPRKPVVTLALNPAKQEKLFKALRWDFLFIPIYVLWFSLLCYLLARATGASLSVTWVVILVMVVTSLFDVSENFVLLHVIKTSLDDGWASAARILEWLKLISPLTGSVYAIVLIGLLVWRFVNAIARH